MGCNVGTHRLATQAGHRPGLILMVWNIWELAISSCFSPIEYFEHWGLDPGPYKSWSQCALCWLNETNWSNWSLAALGEQLGKWPVCTGVGKQANNEILKMRVVTYSCTSVFIIFIHTIPIQQHFYISLLYILVVLVSSVYYISQSYDTYSSLIDIDIST